MRSCVTLVKLGRSLGKETLGGRVITFEDGGNMKKGIQPPLMHFRARVYIDRICPLQHLDVSRLAEFKLGTPRFESEGGIIWLDGPEPVKCPARLRPVSNPVKRHDEQSQNLGITRIEVFGAV